MKLYLILYICILFCVQACDSSSSKTEKPGEFPAPPSTPLDNEEGASTTNPVSPSSEVVKEDPTEAVSHPPLLIQGNSFQLIAGLTISREAFIKDLGVSVSEKVNRFAENTKRLRDSGASYCRSRTPIEHEQLKSAFKDAMLDWQALELYQMGPMKEKNSSLKSEIYNWPVLSYYCRIDAESIYALEDGPLYVLPTENNKIGLQAAEYLIYETSLETGCPIGPTKTSWNTLSREERLEARCAYLQPVLKKLALSAERLKTSWGTPDDNYLSRKAGNTESQQSALQEMFNNILYIDIEMKNKKIGVPAGQDIKGCPSSPAPCLEQQELRLSRLSKEALTANVNVLADLIFGIGEPRRGGLTAVLRNEKAEAAATRSETHVASLLTLVESERGSFDELLISKGNEACEATQESWICKVHKSIRTVVADFKDEYASILRVQVPLEKQGDND